MLERCIVSCVFLTALLFSSAGMADIYKCKTDEGIVYSETKCADDSSIELNLDSTSFYNKGKKVNRDEKINGDKGNLLIERRFGKVLDFSEENIHTFSIPLKNFSKINGVRISFSEIPDYRVTIIAHESIQGETGRVISRKYYSNFLMDGCQSKPQAPCNIAELKRKDIDPVFMETTGSGDAVYIVVKGYKSTSSRERFMKVDSISVFGDEFDTTNPTAELPSPELLEPNDGAQFNHFPRRTALSWNSVSNAASYSVEVESCSSSGATNCSLSRFEDNIRGTTYEFGFVGAQWGRWRVHAVDQDQLSSKPSRWSTFRYNR